MQVALFITCFNDTLFPNVGIATTRLLERLGIAVEFPETQTCCGQMHFNTGYQRESIPLVRHFVRGLWDVEVVVAPSASCVGMVRDLFHKAAALSGDTTLVEAVERLIPRVYELSEFLVKRLNVTDVGAYYPHRVTYHPTCHSLRVLHVGDAPLQLLRAVKGIDLVELPNARECCGFGGHLRYQERRHLTGHAQRQDALRARYRCRGTVCSRHLLSDAHWWGITSPACGRGDRSPGRNPGQRGKRGGVMASKSLPMFPQAAKLALANSQLRRNLGKATTTIRAKRAVVAFTIQFVPVLSAL